MVIVTVLLALPAYQPAWPEFYLALADLHTALLVEGIPFKRCSVPRVAYLDETQNLLVHSFLPSGADHLVLIENDHKFDPREMIRLIRRAEREGIDCLGADYPKKAFGQGMVCERVPGAEVIDDLVPCNYLGLGFTVISRRAIEALVRSSPETAFAYESGPSNGQLAYSVFESVRQDGRRFEPSVVFFSRLRKAGITPMLDTSVKVDHIGMHIFTEKDAT